MKTLIQKTKGAPVIKIQTGERIDSLRNGLVYMNSLQYYRDLENANLGDDVVGDAYEGQIHVHSGRIIIPKLKRMDLLNGHLFRTSIDNSYVFCMFAIPKDASTFTFSDLQKEKLPEFGDSALIITDRDEFVRRVFDKLRAGGYRVTYGNVSYFNPAIDTVSYFFDLIKQSIIAAAFKKRDLFSYQQEFRIIAMKDGSLEDHIEINIGDISDITEKVSINQLLSATFAGHKC